MSTMTTFFGAGRVRHAQTPAAAPLQACFVYVSPVGQAGWTYQHDQGRQAMEQALWSP